MTTIEDFLKQANLIKATNADGISYLQAFEDEGIDDLETLFEYSDEELFKDCKFKKGHWKKFLKYKNGHIQPGEPSNVSSPPISSHVTREGPQQQSSPRLNKHSDLPVGNSIVQQKPQPKKQELYDPRQCKQVSIAFVGMTGAGKTTLLASLRDYLGSRTYDDILPTLKWEEKYATNENFKNRKNIGTGESRTKTVTTYPCSNREWNLRIIDTPGLADTQGLDVDENHAKELVRGLAEASEFNALCIVLKNGDNRKTVQLEYVVNALKTNFPRSIINNIIIMVTQCNSDVISQETEDVLKALELPTKHVIPIENKAYSTINTNNLNDNKLQKHIRRMKEAYTDSHEQLQLLLETAHKLKPYKSKQIDDLIKKKENLLLKFGEVRDIMSACVIKQTLIEKKQKELNKKKIDLQNLQKTQQKKEKEVQKKFKEAKKLENNIKNQITESKKYSNKIKKEERQIDKLEFEKSDTDNRLKTINSSDSTTDLLKKKNDTEDEKKNIEAEIDNTKQQIRICKNNIQSYEDEIEASEDYEYTEKVPVSITKDVHRQTKCDSCKVACHNPCYLSGDGIEGCACMDSLKNACTECYCPTSNHYWTDKVTETTMEDVIKINETKKEMYDNAIINLENERKKLSQLENNINIYEQRQVTIENEFNKLQTQFKNEKEKIKSQTKNLNSNKQAYIKKITKLEETRKMLTKKLVELEVQQKKLESQKLICDKECDDLEKESNKLKIERKSRESDIKRLEKSLLDLKNDYRKSKQAQDDAENKVARIYVELEKIALLGYNHSYYSYVQTRIKAIKSDSKIQPEEAKKKIDSLQSSLKKYQHLKQIIQKKLVIVILVIMVIIIIETINHMMSKDLLVVNLRNQAF